MYVYVYIFVGNRVTKTNFSVKRNKSNSVPEQIYTKIK